MSEPEVQFNFLDTTTVPTPYNGPGKKIRPVIKVIVIAYFLVWVVISTLILKEQTLGEVLWGSLPALFCLGWLWTTRTKNVATTMPVGLAFYQDHFVLCNPQVFLKPLFKKPEERSEWFSSPYKEVRCIRFNRTIQRVVIHSNKLDSQLYHRKGDEVDGQPFWTRTGAAAISFSARHLTQEEFDALMGELISRTGQKVDAYGEYPKAKIPVKDEHLFV